MKLINGKGDSVIGNFAKKSFRRPYSQETINTKLQEIENLERKVEKDYCSGNMEVKLRQKTFDRFRMHTYIWKKEDYKSLKVDANEIATVTKLIPIFTGKKEVLYGFTTNLLHKKRKISFPILFSIQDWIWEFKTE